MKSGVLYGEQSWSSCGWFCAGADKLSLQKCSLSVLYFECIRWEQGDDLSKISLLRFLLSILEADTDEFYDIT